ncbi:hypothetical protein [Phenylobacterium deserti]|uniref:hypothetical protein n=1 Tax=Phenylobacterium deserti TaxID=1914756 RepID=UPI001402AEAC|nr:hypothetical protein [Phenylobacterium deserti]
MTRNHTRDDKLPALDKALKDMFRSLQNRPVPSTLRSVVEQLDDGPDEQRLKKSG